MEFLRFNLKKNILILNPMQTSKFLNEDAIKESEIFPKVLLNLFRSDLKSDLNFF